MKEKITMENVNFIAPLTAADAGRRVISGRIAPYGEVGDTSAGATIFAPNSIRVLDASKVHLRLEHDKKAPIGKMIEFSSSPTGLFASFKISTTSKGNDSIIEAAEGLRSGLSVGIDVVKSSRDRSGNLVVTDAIMREVSLVAEAAFNSALVTSVAASTPEEVPPTPPQEREAGVSTTEIPPATPEATPEVAPAVEAARPTITTPAMVEASQGAGRGVGYTNPRIKPMSSGQYLKHSLIAFARGDGAEESRQLIAALDAQSKNYMTAALGDDGSWITAANDSASTNTGLTLPQHLQMFITNTFNGVRPAIDAVTKAPLIDNGMSFTIPRLTGAPTAADAAEGAAVSATGMTSDYETITVNKKAGMNTISFELFDRSSPMFYDLFMNELSKAYAKSCDTSMIAAYTASGTQATATAGTNAGLVSFLSVEAAAAYKGTGGDFASNFVASTDQWAAIMGYTDTTGRALYTASGATQNASGNISAQSVVGDVNGFNFFVDHNIATSGIIDESAFLVAPASVYWWESPTTNLRLNVLATGEIAVELYGYTAIGVLKATGVRRYNLI
jgi:HK97 family phage major capsid protein/HK97 family phage prohead protease